LIGTAELINERNEIVYKNSTDTKNIFHLNKIKRNNTVYYKKQRYIDSINKTTKRIKNNFKQTPQAKVNYIGNCFMKFDSHYFDLYPIEEYDSYFLFLIFKNKILRAYMC